MRSTLHQEFPLPWTVQERSSCFVVHDKTSQPLAYIHFEEKSGRLSPINQLTRDECAARWKRPGGVWRRHYGSCSDDGSNKLI